MSLVLCGTKNPVDIDFHEVQKCAEDQNRTGDTRFFSFGPLENRIFS